jgi:uncharacterized membrane protein YciS (DUF1049 family)
MFRWLLILVLLLAATAGLVLGVLNAEIVALNLVFTELNLPLGGLVLCAMALGLIAGLLLSWLLFIVPGRVKRARRSGSHRQGTDLADRSHG